MDYLKPEEEARVLIDEMLAEAGWAVVSRSEYLNVPYAQAVTEALTKGNHEADYLLFLDGRAIGVLEAKRKENSLGGKLRNRQPDILPGRSHGTRFGQTRCHSCS